MTPGTFDQSTPPRVHEHTLTKHNRAPRAITPPGVGGPWLDRRTVKPWVGRIVALHENEVEIETSEDVTIFGGTPAEITSPAGCRLSAPYGLIEYEEPVPWSVEYAGAVAWHPV